MALRLNNESPEMNHFGSGYVKHRKKAQDYKGILSDDTLLKNNLKKKKNFKSFGEIPLNDRYNLLGLFIISVFVRLYSIGYPASIVQYIKRSFFLDYDPPLVKLLFSFIGLLCGFNNVFDENKDYIELGIPYVALRFMSGIMGAFLIPIAYLTIKSAGFSKIAAFLVSALLIFASLTFTAFTFLMWVKFYTEEKRPFKLWWWVWMALTGVGLGLTISEHCVNGLKFQRKFGRFFHDDLYRSFSNKLPMDVAFDSIITLKHVVTGGYLHSHQVPYPRSEDDDICMVKFAESSEKPESSQDSEDSQEPQNLHEPQVLRDLHEPQDLQEPILDWIYDGALIHLEHVKTGRSLHSNTTIAPVSDGDFQKEVSARLFDGFLDTTDLWNVEIAEHDKSDPESSKRVRTIRTKFRLYNHERGCYLFSHFIKLPAWGSDEIEVTCATDGIYQNSLWYIESNSHPDLPEDTEMANYKKIGLFRKFYESHIAMWGYRIERDSSIRKFGRPLSWLFLNSSINFWEDIKEERQIYLFGNPLVWWTSTLAVFGFVIAKLGMLLLEKRGYKDYSTVKAKHFESWAAIFFIGWLSHYFPYLLGFGSSYLYFYFPSLYFAILLIGIGFDLLTDRLTVTNRITIAAIFLLASVYVFTLFLPITYGGSWTRSECNKVKLLNSWEFCDLYDKDYLEEEAIIEIDYDNSPGEYYTKSPAYLTQSVEATYNYKTLEMEWSE
ncbi:25711_t:CDS:10 [Dentiscutata erythropus]|uniref:Dolichyl-phosphate-mannose--protein mannosyltransferase n=1 Tax=Dentiscutata erythropus TaxID=1348616 RepID=A0A9N8ZJ23_9GLOM|nr:25711_t:CDS:10 [Dentiscutata erythropus]